MTFNSDLIIKEIRTDFERLLDFVMGEAARTASADRIERGLFRLLLALGAKLLTLFFAMRSQACGRDCLALPDGRRLAYHRDTKRDYFSIFGKLAFWRPYFYTQGLGGAAPLDAELSLGADCYSDLLREVSEYLAVYSVYHKTGDILERLLGLPLSTRVVAMNLAEDATDVEAYYAQKAAPAPSTEAEILVIQADGKGVPMILEKTAADKLRLGKGEKRGRKKEAVVTGVYTIAPAVRTPEQVVASFFDQTEALGERSKPQNKHLWATLEGKDTALARLAKQVTLRQGSHIQDQVALCDGCEALQSRIAKHFPDFTLVLDFIHANEYLWKVANSLLGETAEQRTEWVQSYTLQMLSGQTDQLIAEFRKLAQQPKVRAAQRTQLQKTADYFERNLPYMDYPTYLSKGWPIASGVIEGACRHFVKDRCELSGMRWRKPGAETLLSLRAVAENEDWDAYHSYRKQQRHRRLYGLPRANSEVMEILALDSPMAVQEPGKPNGQGDYHRLPLAA